MHPLAPSVQPNFAILRDCLSTPIIYRSAPNPNNGKRRQRPKGRKNASTSTVTPRPTAETDTNDAEDLADFIDYIATELFASFPPDLQSLSYASIKNNNLLAELYPSPLPPSTLTTLLTTLPPTIPDSLLAYRLIDSPTDLPTFLTPPLTEYISSATAPPPPLLTCKKADACEICGRDWIPLTYHHLIPREVHKKAVKRGWCEEWRLGSVAWLCRACHCFVHGVAGNEELGREWYSVERLLEREDVRGWADWVGRVRWKAR